MKKYIYLHNFKSPPLMKVTALGLLLLSSLPLSAKSASTYREGFYVNPGFSWGQIFGKQTSTIKQEQAGQSVTSQYQSKTGNIFGVAIGAGYQQQLSKQFIADYGVRLARYSTEIKGDEHDFYQGKDIGSYQYNLSTAVTNAALVGRLIYHPSDEAYFDYFVQANVGVSFLETSFSGRDNDTPPKRDAKNTHSFAYGAGLGVLHRVNAHQSFNVSVNYENLGTAKTGKLSAPYMTENGTVERKLKSVSLQIGFSYVF